MSFPEKDILRLDVPMYHTLSMHRAECVSDFGRDSQSIINRKLLLAVQTVAE